MGQVTIDKSMGRIEASNPNAPKGCGAWTHVAGTNGGKMPCGAILKHFNGAKYRYYCPKCQEANNAN